MTSELVEAKKLDRAKRFGLETPEVIEEKKKQRAERFANSGASITANAPIDIDVEKLKVRLLSMCCWHMLLISFVCYLMLCVFDMKISSSSTLLICISNIY